MPRLRRPPWIAILVSAAVLAAVLSKRYAVGFLNDDADYILAARTLAHGGGFLSKLFNNHLLRDRVPGLPLLLAPFVLWAEPPFNALKIIPWLATLVSCWLIWIVFDDELKPWPRFAALALFAFNPLVIEYAGRVMSEAVFTAVVLGSFSLMRRLAKKQSLGLAIVLGALLGWAGLIRGEGFALIAAVVLGFLMMRRWWTLIVTGMVGGGIVAAVSIGNYLTHRTPTHYLQIWSSALPFAGPGYWLSHAATLLRLFVWITLFGGEHFPATSFAIYAATALGLLWLALFARGLRQLERETAERGVLIAIYGFVALYVLIHVLWPVADPRFFIPILPMALVATIAGIPATGRLRQPIIVLGLAGWLIAYGKNHDDALADAWRSPEQVPSATFAWIDHNTPPDARFWGFYDSSLIQLYTNRPAEFMPVAGDEEGFRYELLNARVNYIFYAPLRAGFEPVAGIGTIAARWQASQSWAASSPAFNLVYANAGESTRVYEVLPSDSFERAYGLYSEAMNDFRQSLLDDGLHRLDEALKADPNLVSALNAYGATCLLTGRHLDLAERRLREAVRLRPDYQLAKDNLARLVARRKG